MINPIAAHQLPLQQARPLREADGAADVVCCLVRVVAAVAYLFFVLLRSIFYCGHPRSLEERAIREIPTRNRDAVRAVANTIFDAAQNPVPPVRLSDAVKYEIIKIISEIPAEEREAIMPLLKRTVLDGKAWLADSLIRSVVAIRASRKAEAIQCALLLITPDMSIAERKQIVETIAEILPTERRQVAELTLHLSGRRFPIDRKRIIEAVGAIPAHERDNVVHFAQELITPEMITYDMIQILEAVWAIPAHERDNVVHFAQELITPEMFTYDMIQILENVARRPAHARAAYVAGQREGVDALHARGIFDAFRAQARVRVNLGVARPVRGLDIDVEDDDDEPVNANHREIMRDGVNVHQGNRDQLVGDAIKKLYKKQGPIPQNNTAEAADAFVDYLFTSSKKEVQKQLAIEALLKRRQRDEDFGPLIDGEDFIVNGLQLSGLDLIGRLWIFASQLKEEKERINAKEAMIGALANSYEIFNGKSRRVCNPGKTQRLVISVLQGEGRLEGVNVDRVEIPTQVSAADAMRLFLTLTPENQRIDDFNVLKDKAEQYLKENPGVDKDEFRKEVAKYAELQEMENLPKK